MLLAALLVAQASPFACTFASALAGQKCTYEADAARGDARDNSKLAADAGVKACAAAARKDAALRKDCENAVAEAALGPRCAIVARLADADGNLTLEAAPCVEAVRLAISRTSRAAAVALDCCRCLAESRCAVPASQCKSELAELMPGAALQKCLAKSCGDTCAFVAPPPAPAREPSPPPASKTDAAFPDKI